jgi:RNA polymerase I-specific transcription initiation factor RRN6
LYVLTTSRVYWVEAVPVDEDRQGGDGFAGARVLLSYRHFRNPDDETMRLTVINDENSE